MICAQASLLLDLHSPNYQAVKLKVEASLASVIGQLNIRLGHGSWKPRRSLLEMLSLPDGICTLAAAPQNKHSGSPCLKQLQL